MKIEIKENFTIPNSTPQQRKLGGKATHPTQGLKYARAAWRALVERYAPVKPIAKGTPVRLCVQLFYYRKGNPAFKTTKPDGDNLLKIIKDAMTSAGFWEDDALVADERIVRYHSCLEEHVEIEVETLE